MSVASVTAIRSPIRPLLLRLRQRPVFVVAAMALVAFFVIGAVPSLLAAHDPFDQDLLQRQVGSSSTYLLGTDHLGRDVLSRLFYALGTSLRSSLIAIAVATIIGVPLGIVTGAATGIVGAIIDRVTDAMMSLPALVLAIAIGAALGRSLTTGMIAVGIVYSFGLIRLVRSSTTAVLAEDFVAATAMAGHSSLTIARRHVLPHVARPLVVQLALLAAAAIEIEAALSFLSLGAEINSEVSLGGMVQSGIPYLQSDPRLLFIPAAAIFAMVLAWTLLADVLRDELSEVG